MHINFSIKNIATVAVLSVFIFGAFTVAQSLTNTVAVAEACCGSDGGGGDVGGGGGDGGGGGGTPPPTCDISTNISVVNHGDQYTISWNGTPATGATFKVNDYPVSAVGQKTYTFTAANYSRFVFTGQNAGGTCVDEVRVTRRVVEAPVCNSFSATPANLPVGGGDVNLVWDTTNATEAKLDGLNVAGDGSKSVNVTANKTFTLTLSNSVGSVSCTAPVTVATPTPAPTCDSFTSNPTSIVRGNAATLTWATTNADSVTINQGIGAVAVDGTKVVTPTNTITYILTATKGAQSITCPVVVTVTDIPTPNAPVCILTATPSTINKGASSKLTWTSQNTVGNGVIDQAVGLVDPRNTAGFRNVTPLATITYKLTVRNSANVEATCQATVTVIQPETPTPITCAANVDFTASSYSIREGNSSVLTWDTTGIDSVRISGVGSTAVDGSETVSPRSDTTYTLTATKGTDSVNCPLTINVDEDNGGGGGGSSAPKCTLKISDSNISLGERVTLKWDTTRATEIVIKDNHGKTLIDTDDMSSSEKKDLYDGEITLRPERDTTYTLVASKGSRDKTCKVSVDVEDTVVVTQVRDQQPLVTGIALTQVPYTGFEAGPFMTSVFYTLLAAWALYMAYVLVGRRNGTSVSAFTPAMVTSDVVPSAALYPEKVTETPVFHQVATPVVAATTATVGYAAHTDITTTLEKQAHAAHVLLSSDAISYFVAATAGEDKEAILAGVLAAAKASYPSEDGWVVISAERMVELAAKF